MYIIILGPPGSGKGTQSRFITEKYNIPSISTGELLRAAASDKNNPLSDIITQTISKGVLMDNETIIQVIDQRLQSDDCKNGFILDGFPRSLEQAKLMDQIFQSDRPNVVLNIAVDAENLVKRLTGRLSCSDCGQIYNKFFLPTKVEGICDVCGGTHFIYRSDDEVDVIKRRIEVYQNETKPVIEYYHEKEGSRNFFMEDFDGQENPDVLSSKILKYLDAVLDITEQSHGL